MQCVTGSERCAVYADRAVEKGCSRCDKARDNPYRLDDGGLRRLLVEKSSPTLEPGPGTLGS